jgi:predicted GIY-YIG superfamily endonuclease
LESIEIAVEKLKNKTNINENVIRYLFNVALTQCCFEFNNKYYLQNKGLPMGSSLSPFMAELFMSNLEEQKLKNAPFEIGIYKRYMDDCFLEVSRDINQDEILKFFNSWHPAIKFTGEGESKRCLNFLDIKIERGLDKYKTCTYRKEIHPGRVQDFNSNIPTKYKIQMIYNLLDRNNKISSNIGMRTKGESQLKTILRRSGYPDKFTNKIFYRWHKNNLNKMKVSGERQKLKDGNDNQTLQKNIYFGIKYSGKKSYEYIRSIKNLIQRNNPKYRIRTYFKKNPSTLGILNKYSKTNKLTNPGIYKIECICGKQYIGETGRAIHKRLQEHQNYKYTKTTRIESGSAMKKHETEFKHHVDYQNSLMLKMETNWTRRKIYEALMIKKFKDKLVDSNTNSFSLSIY